MPPMPRLPCLAAAFTRCVFHRVASLNFVFSYFWKQKILIVTTFVPNAIPGSNPGTGRHFEHFWLA
jgi:hypothetical protein